MLEASEVVVPLELTHSSYADHVVMSTADIAFLAAGAFSGFQQVAHRRAIRDNIGFGRAQGGGASDLEAIAVDFTDEQVENVANFQAYGFLPELIARFTRIVPFRALDAGTLREILKTDVIDADGARVQARGVRARRRRRGARPRGRRGAAQGDRRPRPGVEPDPPARGRRVRRVRRGPVGYGARRAATTTSWSTSARPAAAARGRLEHVVDLLAGVGGRVDQVVRHRERDRGAGREEHDVVAPAIDRPRRQPVVADLGLRLVDGAGVAAPGDRGHRVEPGVADLGLAATARPSQVDAAGSTTTSMYDGWAAGCCASSTRTRHPAAPRANWIVPQSSAAPWRSARHACAIRSIRSRLTSAGAAAGAVVGGFAGPVAVEVAAPPQAASSRSASAWVLVMARTLPGGSARRRDTCSRGEVPGRSRRRSTAEFLAALDRCSDANVVRRVS